MGACFPLAILSLRHIVRTEHETSHLLSAGFRPRRRLTQCSRSLRESSSLLATFPRSKAFLGQGSRGCSQMVSWTPRLSRGRVLHALHHFPILVCRSCFVPPGPMDRLLLKASCLLSTFFLQLLLCYCE